MSVPVTMVVVHKSVPTLLVTTHVDVTLDTSWMEMDSHAMVNINMKYAAFTLFKILDINECSTSNGGCEDTCMNTDGSFECSCSTEGYQLSGDGLTCEGM